MKQINLYECEFCHTQYKKEADCKMCESRHVHPVKIIRKKYNSVNFDATGYPASIEIEMKDGNIVKYKRY